MDHRDAANAWKYWIDRRTRQDHIFNLSVDPHEERDMRETLPVALTGDWHDRALAQIHCGGRAATDFRREHRARQTDARGHFVTDEHSGDVGVRQN